MRVDYASHPFLPWDARTGAHSSTDLHLAFRADMVSHMKTTVEIPDSLLDDAKRTASRERTTVKALIIEGLRRILLERRKAAAFRLRKVTFKGEGLQPHVADATWERIRDASYEGRGS